MAEPKLPETMTLEERIPFFHSYQKLVTLFGEEAVNEGLMRYKISNLCEIRRVIIQVNGYPPRKGVNPKPFGPEQYLGNHWCFTEIRHPTDPSYSKHGKALCACFLSPNQYQSVYEVECVTRPALLAKLPFLADYKLQVYSSGEEFYLNLETKLGINGWCGSLYVPYAAAILGNEAAIVKRSKDYLEDYARGVHDTAEVNWENISKDPNVVRFFEDLKKYREGLCRNSD